MRATAFALLLSGAAAFAPAPARRTGTQLKAALNDMPGYDIETSGKPFDPMGLAEYAPLDFLRQAELKHGRVAMLAWVGWLAPEVTGILPAGDITSAHAWDALAQCDPQGWFQIVGLCGIIEASQWRHESSKTTPFWDPAGVAPKDEKEMARMQLKELKNGRAAMIGIAAAAAAHYIPGSVPGFPFPY